MTRFWYTLKNLDPYVNFSIKNLARSSHARSHIYAHVIMWVMIITYIIDMLKLVVLCKELSSNPIVSWYFL
jgi:hypothetical protein